MGASVVEDLQRWGPDVTFEPVVLKTAQAYTKALATSHYENFPVASLLVPRHLRQHFYNVYAFCRWSDDLGDEVSDPERSLVLLEWWKDELEQCFAGSARHPVFVALQPTVEEFGISQKPFADLISAFVQDQSVTEYQTYEQLLDYCRRSADPVGRIVLHLYGKANTENFAFSDSICTGLQLANFWQDVSRDLDIGRVYLPAEDRDRFGYSDPDLDNRRMTPAFRELMAFEVERARTLLLGGKPLVAAMRGRARVEIDLFIRGGLLVLQGIQAARYDVWAHRPKVSKRAIALEGCRSLLSSLMLGKPRHDS